MGEHRQRVLLREIGRIDNARIAVRDKSVPFTSSDVVEVRFYTVGTLVKLKNGRSYTFSMNKGGWREANERGILR